MPFVALRSNVVFPGITTRIPIGRKISENSIKNARSNNNLIIFGEQRDFDANKVNNIEQLQRYGVLAEILNIGVSESGGQDVTVQILATVYLNDVFENDNMLRCNAEEVDYYVDNAMESVVYRQKVLDLMRGLSDVSMQQDKQFIKIISNPELNDILFVNLVSNSVARTAVERQFLLSERNNNLRMEKLCGIIVNHTEYVKVEKRIANRVKKQVDDGQKEYFLREQMKAISKELGEDENEQLEYAKRIEKCQMPEEVAKKAKKEVARLAKMAPTSPDAAVIRNYVDWLCDLPWKTETKDNADLQRAKAILDEDHFGLEKIKERIVEFLAVMHLTGKLNGPILCFVGPPGVGKTSIVRSIARALDRKYLRVSLGGVRDEAEIRGHRRTYVGAIPGKIIYMMKQAACINPVMLLDEIDKMGKDNRGDPASAMLEVLDPEQNNTFTDHFLEVPYDLSKVLFVCTANSTDDIPEPLLDRMEIIELSGYTEYEKTAIAEKFLLKKNLQLHGIKEGAVEITHDAYAKIIERYTRESGVRSLEREIAAICRKAALQLVENPKAHIVVTPDNLDQYLGVEKYKDESVDNSDSVGSATGLAWTRVGGTTLSVDATVFDGKGDIQLTGKLGDVMKESARTAISVVRSLAEKYGVDKQRFEKTDIHIHVPEGAIPKDGPSAGITMATAIMSAFSGRPVSGKVAMTGEITLRGKVLPIGGLKEKCLAAYRVGIHKIIIPKDNEKDIAELPKEIASDMDFVLADNIETVYNNALV